MDTSTEGISINLTNAKCKVDSRSRNRMKITIKLSADQAESVNNFMGVVKPAEVPQEDFFKTVFYTGLQAMNDQLVEMTKAYAAENAEELAEEGIEVLEGEDGGVLLQEIKAEEEAPAERLADPED